MFCRFFFAFYLFTNVLPPLSQTHIEMVYDGVHDGHILGEGVTGVVRLVIHRATGVRYAMKRIAFSRVAAGEEGLEQLRNEIFIMCQVRLKLVSGDSHEQCVRSHHSNKTQYNFLVHSLIFRTLFALKRFTKVQTKCTLSRSCALVESFLIDSRNSPTTITRRHSAPNW